MVLVPERTLAVVEDRMNPCTPTAQVTQEISRGYGNRRLQLAGGVRASAVKILPSPPRQRVLLHHDLKG